MCHQLMFRLKCHDCRVGLVIPKGVLVRSANPVLFGKKCTLKYSLGQQIAPATVSPPEATVSPEAITCSSNRTLLPYHLYTNTHQLMNSISVLCVYLLQYIHQHNQAIGQKNMNYFYLFIQIHFLIIIFITNILNIRNRT